LLLLMVHVVDPEADVSYYLAELMIASSREWAMSGKEWGCDTWTRTTTLAPVCLFGLTHSALLALYHAELPACCCWAVCFQPGWYPDVDPDASPAGAYPPAYPWYAYGGVGGMSIATFRDMLRVILPDLLLLCAASIGCNS
jgi:hypothetical protein